MGEPHAVSPHVENPHVVLSWELFSDSGPLESFVVDAPVLLDTIVKPSAMRLLVSSSYMDGSSSVIQTDSSAETNRPSAPRLRARIRKPKRSSSFRLLLIESAPSLKSAVNPAMVNTQSGFVSRERIWQYAPFALALNPRSKKIVFSTCVKLPLPRCIRLPILRRPSGHDGVPSLF